MRRGAFSALALLALLALPGAAAATLQELVDAAPAGSTLVLPSGVFFENVRVGKSLALVGSQTRIDGGLAPALDLSNGSILIQGVRVSAVGPPIRMHDAPDVEVRNLIGRALLTAERVGWVRVAVPPGNDSPSVELRDAAAVYGHPVHLLVLYSDGAAWPGAEVEVWDNGALAWAGKANERGSATVFVAARWERHSSAGGLERGTNTTEVRVPAAGFSAPLSPAAGGVTLRTATARAPPLAPEQAAGLVVAITALGVVGAALHSHEGFRWRWMLLFAPLYVRLARREVMEHGTREAIYGYVEEHPGVHLRGIKRSLGLQHGTLLHHLGMLERQRFLRSVKDGMYRRYFVVGAALQPEPGDRLADVVLREIRARPGTTNGDIAALLGKRPSLVHYHVERLAEQGRVRKHRDGRAVRLFDARDPAAGPSGDAPGGPAGSLAGAPP